MFMSEAREAMLSHLFSFMDGPVGIRYYTMVHFLFENLVLINPKYRHFLWLPQGNWFLSVPSRRGDACVRDSLNFGSNYLINLFLLDFTSWYLLFLDTFYQHSLEGMDLALMISRGYSMDWWQMPSVTQGMRRREVIWSVCSLLYSYRNWLIYFR